MHRKTQTLTHTPKLVRTHMHTHTLQTQFSCRSQRQRQSAIPLSKRLSDDESERFLPLIFDVQRGCDQRSLTLPLFSLSLFLSIMLSVSAPPAVKGNTHSRQEQTVSSCLLILCLLLWLAGVFQANDDFYL